MQSSIRSVIDVPLPTPKKVTAKSKELTIKESHRFRGSVRITCGKFYTDEEFESRRKRILSTPLP